eukprot:30837-Pelagococcus_subviridis.AAC.12
MGRACSFIDDERVDPAASAVADRAVAAAAARAAAAAARAVAEPRDHRAGVPAPQRDVLRVPARLTLNAQPRCFRFRPRSRDHDARNVHHLRDVLAAQRPQRPRVLVTQEVHLDLDVIREVRRRAADAGDHGGGVGIVLRIDRGLVAERLHDIHGCGERRGGVQRRQKRS